MLIEVIIHDRIASFLPGQVVEIEDGVFLRALVKGGKADVVNPPDWSLETVLAAEQSADTKPSPQIPESRKQSRRDRG